METRTLTNRDGFGLVDRSDEDVACKGGNVYCQIIDDATVYYKIVPKDVFNRVYDDATTDRVNFPNFPPGRIPAFYLVFVIAKRYKAYANRSPKIGEIIWVLDTVDSEVRGLSREDDYQLADILIRYKTGKKLSPTEQAILDSVIGKVKNKPPKKKKKSNLPYIIGGVALLAVVIGGVAVARRKRNAQ